MEWANDRNLVITRWVDTEHTDVLVLDGDARFTPSASCRVKGQITALAVRPDGHELAVATNWYRARTKVEVDEQRLAIYGLDGTLRVRVDVPSVADSIAWSPHGDALLVSTDAAVTRYRLK